MEEQAAQELADQEAVAQFNKHCPEAGVTNNDNMIDRMSD